MAPTDYVSADHVSGRVTGERLYSLDTYRGLTMLLLAFTVPNYDWAEQIAAAHPDSSNVHALLSQFEHVDWQGIVLWDMIQPSFMFMVGVSVAYSYASRSRRGQTYLRMLLHAVYRAVVLMLLGVFLRSLHAKQTYWTFEDVVTQIGLGYVPLFLLWGRSWRVQLGVCAAILVGYWLLFALWPLPPHDYDYAAAHGFEYYTGFLAHWNKNANPAHYFDLWFLNLFPRESAFVGNSGGYNTLNFIPSLSTMIAGLMAGEVLRASSTNSKKTRYLLVGGGCAILLGLMLHFAGLCPIVKKIWTPSFALVSGGLCCWLLLLAYYLVDVCGYRAVVWPAVVVGMNSVTMYCMTYMIPGWVATSLNTHLGERPYLVLGQPYQHLLMNLSVGFCLWLICVWMYRRRIFLRI